MARNKDTVIKVRLKSSESNHCYYTTKNRRNAQGKMEVKKYDPFVRRHTTYKESGKV